MPFSMNGGCKFFMVLMLLGSSVILWVNLIFWVHKNRQRLVWSSTVVLKWYYHQTASLVYDCHLFITWKGKMVFEPLFSATRRTQNAPLGSTSAVQYMWSQEGVMPWCQLAKWEHRNSKQRTTLASTRLYVKLDAGTASLWDLAVH